MAYHEWGDTNNPNVLLCVHGLSRTGSDFVHVARALASRYRVICPDVVGRGESDWLKDPQYYQLPQYVADINALILQLGLSNRGNIDYLGTSMGGLIALSLVANPAHPIRRLLLNDVGVRLEPNALARIGDYLSMRTEFASLEEGVSYLKRICAPFGWHSQAQWQMLCEPMLRRKTEYQTEHQADKPWRLHYDPAIADNFRLMTSSTMQQAAKQMTQAAELAAWQVWDRLRIPILITRGMDSDLLAHETVVQMCQRNPQAHYVEFAGVGHAPTFFAQDQLSVLDHFFSAI